MHTQTFLHAFGGYGLELEYMIVDRSTLAVRPIAENLLPRLESVTRAEAAAGLHTGWSNEIVAHVVEVKNELIVEDIERLGLVDAAKGKKKAHFRVPPDLRAHVRYAETLIRAQGEVFGLYHTQNARVFFQREDLWSVANQNVMDAKGQKQTQEIDSPPRQEKTGARTQKCQDNAFGKQLRYNANATRPEGSANRDLAPALVCTREQQVCDIGAGDEQNEEHGRNNREQGGSDVTDKIVVE